MPGPLAQRGGKGAPPRPPLIPRRSPTETLRRFRATPPPADAASALPPDVVRALRLVAAELRDMPRDCATDREELVHWHGRLARRLDAVAASKARTSAPVRVGPLDKAPSAAPAVAVAAPAPAAKTRRITAPGSGPPAALPDLRALPARTAPATRWRARPTDAAFRRRSEAAGQLALFAAIGAGAIVSP